MARIKYKEAAGLEVKRGKPSISHKPSKAELKRLYVRESKSIREVAGILGCSKDIVYRCLKEYGIELRPGYNRSKLRKFKLSVLEQGVRDKGVRGYAKELGIHENTLRYYLNGVRKGE
jgi:transposase-like protein